VVRPVAAWLRESTRCLRARDNPFTCFERQTHGQ
jgi:hypothetical protein